MEPMLNPGPLSSQQAVLAICFLAIVAHQLFRHLETYSIPLHTLLISLPILAGFALLKPTMPPLYAACISTAVFFSAMLASMVAYRLSPFHRLAQYPGPFGCRVTKFWMACIGFTGRQHLYLQSLHEQYGDVVRIGPNELSFKDPSIRDALLGSPGVPKGPQMIGRILTVTNLPLLAIADPALHHERRKPWNRAFSAAATKEYEPLLVSRVSQLAYVLRSQKGEFDMSKFLNYFTYDFMCDMAYGGGSELLRDGDMTDIWHTMEQGWPAATFLSHVPWLGLYFARLPVVSASVASLLSYCREFTLQRIQRGAVRKDVFHYLSNEDQPEKVSPPVQQLVDDGVLAIVAGADTTSSALSSLFFSLVTHRDVYDRLQAEVDRFYPQGENTGDAKHHREMHYLTAVINETLRLFPPAPSGSQRQVPHHSQGIMLGPYFVPAGTAMFLHPYSMHRDPRNFSPSTTEFWPERWLIAAGREKQSSGAEVAGFVHNEAAFLPFSHGPANCVGKQLAMQEMRTVVCTVLQKLEVRVRSGWDKREYEEGFLDFFVTKRPMLPVTVHPRY
ncbi:hypothetical protein VTO73DRAFT_10664 [Trametes versicolor]